MWKLGRLARTSDLIDVSVDDGVGLPGFPAFCAGLADKQKTNKIGYLFVKISHALGHQWTIITGDQATYQLATVHRQKYSDIFGKVVLLFGGFHQVHNYIKAICKIIQECGAEELIVSAGLCSKGTAKKIMGERGDYHQTPHAIRVLSEAFTQLHWQAFEKWAKQSDNFTWNNSISKVIEEVVDNDISVAEQSQMILDIDQQLTDLHGSLDLFNLHLCFG